MVTLLRHLLAIAILPLTVTVFVPLWIAGRYAITPSLGTEGGALVLEGAGVVVLTILARNIESTASMFRESSPASGRGRPIMRKGTPPDQLSMLIPLPLDRFRWERGFPCMG